MTEEPNANTVDAGLAGDTVPPAKSTSRLTLILVGILSMFGLLTIVSCVILVMSLQDPTHRERDIGYQKELQALLDEVRKERASPAPDFTAVRQKAVVLKNKIVPVMKNEASNIYPAKQALLFAARDELPRMMAGDLLSESMAEKNLVAHLKIAADVLIHGKTPQID